MLFRKIIIHFIDLFLCLRQPLILSFCSHAVSEMATLTPTFLRRAGAMLHVFSTYFEDYFVQI